MTDRDPEEAMRVAKELFPATLELLRRFTFYSQYVDNCQMMHKQYKSSATSGTKIS